LAEAFVDIHLEEVEEAFDIEACKHCSCFEDMVVDLLVVNGSLVEDMVVGDIVVAVVVVVG
jgi:hypothetical protein